VGVLDALGFLFPPPFFFRLSLQTDERVRRRVASLFFLLLPSPTFFFPFCSGHGEQVPASLSPFFFIVLPLFFSLRANPGAMESAAQFLFSFSHDSPPFPPLPFGRMIGEGYCGFFSFGLSPLPSCEKTVGDFLHRRSVSSPSFLSSSQEFQSDAIIEGGKTTYERCPLPLLVISIKAGVSTGLSLNFSSLSPSPCFKPKGIACGRVQNI